MIVLRLTGSALDGKWFNVPPGWNGLVEVGPVTPPLYPGPEAPDIESGRTGVQRLVATGNLEWDGDRCAEVFVSEDRLALWRAEHHVEVGDLVELHEITDGCMADHVLDDGRTTICGRAAVGSTLFGRRVCRDHFQPWDKLDPPFTT